jgi:hypothetical protein
VRGAAGRGKYRPKNLHTRTHAQPDGALYKGVAEELFLLYVMHQWFLTSGS